MEPRTDSHCIHEAVNGVWTAVSTDSATSMACANGCALKRDTVQVQAKGTARVRGPLRSLRLTRMSSVTTTATSDGRCWVGVDAAAVALAVHEHAHARALLEDLLCVCECR